MIQNLTSLLQAYWCFMVVVLATPTTKLAEAAGLAAHLHFILELSSDLGAVNGYFMIESSSKGSKGVGRDLSEDLWALPFLFS